MIPIILTLIIPIIGILALIVDRIKGSVGIEFIVLGTMLSTLSIFLLGLLLGFSPINLTILKSISLNLSLGIYGINLPFIFIAIIVPLFVLRPAYHEISVNKFWFYFILLFIYLSLVGAFEAMNLLLFFIFWEVAIVSVFLLIFLFSDKSVRFKVSMKFLIFTQIASLFALIAFILIFYSSGTFSVLSLTGINLSPQVAMVIVSLLTLAAMIKMPIFPLHVWLPDTYNYTPNSVVILLSGLFSKLGGFILIAFGFMLFRGVFQLLSPLLWLGVISTIYIAFITMSQRRFKMMISYSSILYMSVVFTAIFSDNIVAIYGAVFLMISYSIISTMLFSVSDLLMNKLNGDDMHSISGLLSKMPWFSLFFIISILAALGIPGFSNFIGEFLTMLGVYISSNYALIILFAFILSTFYYLTAIKHVIFGKFNLSKRIKDISRLDILDLLILTIIVLILGLVPSLIINSIEVL